ncbi:MAG TPA: inorganic pyrophosphatase [Saprospiraceae bacterium]|nr:inorganic pyrophosphatase [Saprospiraceae bacterium]
MSEKPKFKLHPWHGIPYGDECPEKVTAFIEITPSDTIKYEIDKLSGYLKVDRPQKYSNIVPALYGFIPQTYCAEKVADLNMAVSGRKGILGDGDPLDILVLTNKHIVQSDILVKAFPIGGLRLVDDNEADDKIIAIMEGDDVFGAWKDISDIPESIINSLKHYFLTYKQMPESQPILSVDEVYDTFTAYDVIRASIEDYRRHFGG